MSTILNIETSTSVCSVAISKYGKVIASRESPGERSHATQLTPYIEEVLEISRISSEDLDGIAVSKGPGSYTGLRIGVSTAKGMAYALHKPLISIGTLLCMVNGLKAEMPQLLNDKNTLLCPMLDARRMEVYLALYDNDLNSEPEVRAEIINEHSFQNILRNRKIVFFGDGMEKCRNVIRHENAVFVENFNPLARYLADISYFYFLNKKFEDIAYFEPFYLKDFIATTPKNFLKNDNLRIPPSRENETIPPSRDKL
jgi:tRNA threonylcarbamoyladenosine biosynthesis protein TsaB